MAVERRTPPILLAIIALAGCASGTLQVSSTVLTSGTAMQAGRRTPFHSFGHDDYIIQYTDFTWTDPATSGGVHRVTFEWYHDDKLVSKTPSKYLRFESSPYTLWTRRAAATLGIGRFKVQTIVDDQVVSTSTFDITS